MKNKGLLFVVLVIVGFLVVFFWDKIMTSFGASSNNTVDATKDTDELKITRMEDTLGKTLVKLQSWGVIDTI